MKFRNIDGAGRSYDCRLQQQSAALSRERYKPLLIRIPDLFRGPSLKATYARFAPPQVNKVVINGPVVEAQ